VIAGAEDHYLKPKTLREIAARIAGATFVELPAVGHLPMWEAPEQVTEGFARWHERISS
jgi:pimeloyl-ACP methyl ester carboxylesterase